MNNIVKFKYQEIKDFLISKSISINSKVDNDFIFNNLSSINNSNPYSITFFNNNNYIDSLSKTKASACLIEDKYKKLLSSDCIAIVVDDPYEAFAQLTNLFEFKTDHLKKFISDTAILHNDNSLSSNISIHNFVIIKESVKIQENCIIYDNSVIGPNVSLGKNTIIKPNCTISNSIIGNDCVIQSGCIIGDSGFGFTLKNKTEIKHIGNVVIGNNTQIGSNTTIDRATLDSTILGNNVRIDNLVQIAHNVNVGDQTVIAAQTGIAGGAKIGNNCIIGGQAGIAGHISVGNNVTIAAKSGVTKNIKNNSIIAGFPAIDIREWKKNIIRQNKKND
jgi:UDP-3-O-[3-hydroxymyristoyl] glucosamine N-acyltransferase